ncbi:TrkA family potassium uptake protein [Georgenia wutianyii]|uniref:TrkA family potassium uptake protein n=2 Tax=Georgenia wutianyii TaxID=2585135 RepID=A0ABX5VLR7_9MICO|nr:TrkA family potassium uptake protein [Georgenia wutianyii]
MHFVIMGCGRVGASLATQLEEQGHSVAVLDQNPDAFRRLPEDFSGQRVTGLGFDRDALSQTGIEDAHGFAAVSNGDNSNILAARVARETFGVEHVVARIYDQRRAEVYERLGIPTVATVRWTADQMLRRLLPTGGVADFRDRSGQVALVQVDVHHGWVGRPVTALEAASGARAAYLTRRGSAFLPDVRTVLQDGDVLHVLARTDAVERAGRIAGSPPPEED